MNQQAVNVNSFEGLQNGKNKVNDEIKEVWLCENEAIGALNCSKSTLRFFRRNELIDHYKLNEERYYDLLSIKSPSIELRSHIISSSN